MDSDKLDSISDLSNSVIRFLNSINKLIFCLIAVFHYGYVYVYLLLIEIYYFLKNLSYEDFRKELFF
jgi:hypothetical protein